MYRKTSGQKYESWKASCLSQVYNLLLRRSRVKWTKVLDYDPDDEFDECVTLSTWTGFRILGGLWARGGLCVASFVQQKGGEIWDESACLPTIQKFYFYDTLWGNKELEIFQTMIDDYRADTDRRLSKLFRRDVVWSLGRGTSLIYL
jgi:hypothetical protein